jgi:hypothetical protein
MTLGLNSLWVRLTNYSATHAPDDKPTYFRRAFLGCCPDLLSARGDAEILKLLAGLQRGCTPNT